MMSGHANIETAVKATKLGVFDFIEKPLSLDEVLQTVDLALRQQRLLRENAELREHLEQATELIGKSQALLKLRQDIESASDQKGPVLIFGEIGTGKELVARLIQDRWLGVGNPFIRVDCDKGKKNGSSRTASLSKKIFGSDDPSGKSRAGALEKAENGVLYLNSAEHLDREVAVRLAAAIRHGRFQKVGGGRWFSTNAWVILSTTVDLQKQKVESVFGKELADLIEVEPLRVPPLRERWEDIPSLIEHFLSQFCGKLGLRRPVFEEQAIQAMENHQWPENIKALKNIVEKLVVEGTGDVIGLSHLPREIQGVPTENVDVKPAVEVRDEAEWEKEVLSKLLLEQKGNLRQAASQLGISEGHLRGKIKQYGLDASGKGKSKTHQRTLGKSVLLGGQGLHSGLKTGLILSPLPPNSGIRIGGITREDSVLAHLDLVVSTDYATTLHQGAITIRTVEHLMSALHAYNITNVLVRVTDEIPIMDGSAQDFCRLIEEAEIVEQEAFVDPLEVSSVIEVVSNNRNGQQSRLTIEPFPDLVVDYEVVLPKPIGEQKVTFKLDNPESFRDSIAPARTFGLIREVEKQERNGLVGGGRLDNVILLDEGRVINTKLRFPDEFARHKILDIIGDLYLLGRPVKGKVTGRMSGHAENIELLRKLRAQ